MGDEKVTGSSVESAITAYVKERSGTALAPVSDGMGAGFDDLGPIRPSNIVLVQNTTRVGTAGKFRDTASGEEFDELTIAILARRKSRVLFPEGELGAEPLCKSYDGDFPVSEEVLGHPPIHKDCKTCPMASWDNYDRKTRKGKPQCKEQARILFVEKNSGLPYRLTLNGMSLKPLRTLLQVIQKDAFIAAQKGDKRSIYDYYFTITPEKVTGKLGNFYVVGFSTPEVFKPENRGKFGPLYEAYVTNAAKYKEETEAIQEVESELETENNSY
jgi:hypothetical protein